MARHRDLTGARFGRLIAVERHSVANNGGWSWLCVCDCGTQKQVSGDNLRRGKSTSCGCAQRELTGKLRFKHGHRGTPEYKAWGHMKDRCFNPKCDEYQNYGGRGITMCPEWREDFESFLANVGARPSSSHSIDRIDNNGNYEPGNVRWATPTEQVNNRRCNVIVQFRGENISVTEASRRAQISARAVLCRIRRGTPPQIAFERVAAKGGIHVA